jgi:hypothetical protein
MMKKANYQTGLENFWKTRKEAREEYDSKIKNLSFSEKIAITEKLQENSKILIDLKSSTTSFTISSPEAFNETSPIGDYTQEDGNIMLYKVIPSS